MKRLSNCILACLFVLSGSNTHAQSQALGLKLKFGLESTQFYREEQVTSSGNSAIHAPRKKGEPLYRFFAATPAWGDRLSTISERHFKVWEALEKESTLKPFRMDQEAYALKLKERDPYLIGLINDTAPSLYFDFTGLSATEYVLEAIEIRTLSFEEYRGGGFFNNEAWYDILLRHSPGVHTYDVGRRLSFTGSGRAVIRFWSDNWYPNVGMAPQGCYTIDMTFIFTVNGKTQRISTQTFKIDV